MSVPNGPHVSRAPAIWCGVLSGPCLWADCPECRRALSKGGTELVGSPGIKGLFHVKVQGASEEPTEDSQDPDFNAGHTEGCEVILQQYQLVKTSLSSQLLLPATKSEKAVEEWSRKGGERRQEPQLLLLRALAAPWASGDASPWKEQGAFIDEYIEMCFLISDSRWCFVP